MKTWGWVNLLKEVAITKVFDVAGKGNSIDCARDAKCFDVLMLVSEDRLIKESEVLDFESKK